MIPNLTLFHLREGHLTDFTLSNARRFYWSMRKGGGGGGVALDENGLKEHPGPTKNYVPLNNRVSAHFFFLAFVSNFR